MDFGSLEKNEEYSMEKKCRGNKGSIRKRFLYIILACVLSILSACSLNMKNADLQTEFEETEEDSQVEIEETEGDSQQEATEEDGDNDTAQTNKISSVEIINQIDARIFLGLFRETNTQVLGFKAIDLNSDGIQEFIIRLADENGSNGRYFVVDRAEGGLIVEYEEHSAAGTSTMYLDEKSGTAYIHKGYWTIGTEIEIFYQWNDGWVKIAERTGGEYAEESYFWNGQAVTSEEWSGKKDALLPELEEWKGETIETPVLSFDIGQIDYMGVLNLI